MYINVVAVKNVSTSEKLQITEGVSSPWKKKVASYKQNLNNRKFE